MTARDARELPEAATRVAANLTRLRVDVGLDRPALERLADLDEGTVAAIEEATYLPRYGELTKIAAALDVAAAEILDGIRWIPADDGPGGFEVDGPGEQER